MTDVPPPPPPANYAGGGGTPQPMANPLIGYWKKVVLENYANFDGRARRAEFWWYFLANLIISVVFNLANLVVVGTLVFRQHRDSGIGVGLPGGSPAPT